MPINFLQAAFYPIQAVLLPVALADQLQDYLDRFHAVRLDPFAVYPGPPITLRAGMELYGVGTVTPAIQFEAGITKQVKVSGINAPYVVVPPLAQLKHCFFRFMAGTSWISTGVVEHCDFMDITGTTFAVDNSGGGHFSNNHLIRLASQGTKDWLVIQGNAAEKNRGNIFELVNNLDSDPTGTQVYFDNFEDVTFVGVDTERNRSGASDLPVIRFGAGSGAVRIIGSTGRLQTGYWIDVGAASILVANQRCQAPFLFKFSAACKTAVVLDSDPATSGDVLDLGATTHRYDIMVGDNSVRKDGQQFQLAPMMPQDFAALSAVLSPRIAGRAPSFSIWEPSAAFPDMNAVPVDSTASVQADLDAGKVVVLPPGRVWLNVRSGSKKGLIGAGAGRTFVTAFDPAKPAISYSTGDVFNTVLADLTLHSCGVSAQHFEPGSDCFNAFFSHITFLGNMIGTHVDKASLDTITWEECDYVGNGQGVLYGDAGGNWIDKNAWVRCRFVANTHEAVSGMSTRGCNLNLFADCLFQGNGRAFTGNAWTALAFTRCHFANNRGDPSVFLTGGNAVMVQCSMDVDGATSMVDAQPIFLFECSMLKGTGTGQAMTAYTYESPKFIVNSYIEPALGARTAQNLFAFNSELVADPTIPPSSALLWQTFVLQALVPFGPAQTPNLFNR